MTTLMRLLLKDTVDKNELNKTAIATRCCCMLSILYSIIFAIIAFVQGTNGGMFIVLGMLVGFAIALYMTYGKSIRKARVIVNITTLVGISATVVWFGWNSGIQHFLFGLVLFNILFARLGIVAQMFSAAGVCATRLALYFYCKFNEPIFILSDNVSAAVQICSTIAVFLIIFACGVNYAIDNKNTENKILKYNKELQMIASTDPLTKLWNRYRMFEFVSDFLKDKARFCSICLCDIDFFKKINDTYGHEAGDKVLVTLADIFREGMNMQGAVARWGGEEFLLFFEDVNGDDALMRLSEIRQKIKNTVVEYDDKKISFTMTFGLVEYDKELTLDGNIKIADDRLYKGKNAGRDQIVY